MITLLSHENIIKNVFNSYQGDHCKNGCCELFSEIVSSEIRAINVNDSIEIGVAKMSAETWYEKWKALC